MTCRICDATIYCWQKRTKKLDHKNVVRHLMEEGGLVEHIIQVQVFGNFPPPF